MFLHDSFILPSAQVLVWIVHWSVWSMPLLTNWLLAWCGQFAEANQIAVFMTHLPFTSHMWHLQFPDTNQ